MDEPIRTRSGLLPVTVSVGSAEWSQGDDLAALLARVDQALSRAKASGRNWVVALARS